MTHTSPLHPTAPVRLRALSGTRSRLWRLSVITVLLVAGNHAQAYSQNIIRNVTPAAWQSYDFHWVRDVSPRNRIDDLIDGSADPTFDVVLNYRRCPDTTDVTQLNDLAGPGHVQMRLKYISSIAMSALRKGTLDTLVQLIPDIVFIEKQVGFGPFLDVSVPAIKVASGFYTPTTVQDVNPALTGTGVNVVIMDTGVDNRWAVPILRTSGYDRFSVVMG